MSFNFNPVGNEFNQPIIKQSSSVGDGSGGNTGYFQQEQQEEDEQEQERDEFDKSIFNEDDDDSFLQESDSDLAKKIFDKFKKLFGNK